MSLFGIKIKQSLALILLGAFLFGHPVFAATQYKAENPALGVDHDSLQGWDGNLPPICTVENFRTCEEKQLWSYHQPRTWYPVVQLGAGVVVTGNVGQSNSFQIINPNTDELYEYNAQQPSQSGAFFEVFLGSEWLFKSLWALQTGVDFSQVYTNYSAGGMFTQGADLQSANQFNYSYNATIRQVLAEAKLLYHYHERFHPYGLLGLGVGFNSAYSYSTSVPPFLTFTRQFSDNTTTTFTYALGLGVDFDISEAIRLGVGYRFTDFGKIQLGPATINNIQVSGTLSQVHMYSNLLLAQVTFVF